MNYYDTLRKFLIIDSILLVIAILFIVFLIAVIRYLAKLNEDKQDLIDHQRKQIKWFKRVLINQEDKGVLTDEKCDRD